MVAQATRRWDGKYALRFPFNRDLVEGLKLHIPATYREYEPTTKTWIVDAVHAATALHLLRSAFPDATITNPEEPKQHRFRRSDPHHVLYLHPDAPACVIRAAYRALCMEFHPDRAPADKRDQMHEEQIALNRAYAALCDRISS